MKKDDFIHDKKAYCMDCRQYSLHFRRTSQHPDFFSVPLNIHFGEKQFVDGVDLNPQQLYEKIKNAKEFPKSSQPSAGEFAERYKVIANSMSKQSLFTCPVK